MFRVKQDCCPTVPSNLFRDNKSVHNYCTRQADQINVPVDKRNYMQKVISFKGFVEILVYVSETLSWCVDIWWQSSLLTWTVVAYLFYLYTKKLS